MTVNAFFPFFISSPCLTIFVLVLFFFLLFKMEKKKFHE